MQIKKLLSRCPSVFITTTVASIDVSYVAALARLKLADDEVHRFEQQLGNILEHMHQLQQVNTDRVPAHAVDPNLPTNIFRKDEVKASFEINDALANAPIRANDLIIVPKIVE